MTNELIFNEDAALASDLFDRFAAAQSFKSILEQHRGICEVLRLRPTNFLDFYPAFKRSLRSWKAQSLWSKLDKKAQQKIYEGGRACSDKKVLIVGSGPCGLRSAIEAQLLGAKVVVIEKRNKFSRNNVLHIWPFVIKDLMSLGIKIFFGKFCAGSINHISIRQLQCVLLKVALCLGVEVFENVSYEGLIPPEVDDPDVGWKAQVSPPDHPVNHFEFDMIIGANGKRAVFDGFKRNEFRGKLAIAITANFVNNRTEQEARVEEISGVAFIFRQKFFTDMCEQTGIDLENIVYYKDDTHYFVMTAKKHSLLWRQVLYNDYPDTEKLLAPDNVNREALYQYAYDAAMYATNNQLPDDVEFALNHYNKPDVAMFDFTSMFASENASRIVERNGKQLLMALVGDGLLEPFWPTGTGCARGFLGCFDACYMFKRWAKGEKTPLEVIAERESIYRLLGQTTSENICKDEGAYTLDPRTRYPNLNARKVLPIHVRHLFDTDRPEKIETMMRKTNTISKEEKENMRSLKALKSQESRLLSWFRLQLVDYPLAETDDICTSFQTGQPLCALIHRYRPDLLDYKSLDPEDFVGNCAIAFDVLLGMGIKPVISAEEFAINGIADKSKWISYLQSVYLLFKGQIPYMNKAAKAESDDELQENSEVKVMRRSRKSDESSLMKRVKRRRTEAGSLTKSKPKPPPRAKNKFGEPVFDKRQLEYLSRILLVKSGGLQHATKEDDDELPDMVDEVEKIDFDDMNLFLYRLESDFSDKQSKLEKMLFGGKENKDSKNFEIQRPSRSDDFSAKVNQLQQKFQANSAASDNKKPKELIRAIGKLDEKDWNIQRLKKKAEDPLLKSDQGESKVPKWNRDQFHDKLEKINKLADGRKDDPKFSQLDEHVKLLDKKLKGEAVLSASNKVSQAMQRFSKCEYKVADQDIRSYQEIAQEKAKEVSSRLPVAKPSDNCYVCKNPVYLVERVCTEGKVLHKKCLRCEYCKAGLRIGGYTFVRDIELGGGYFYCPSHASHHQHKFLLVQPTDQKAVDVPDRPPLPEKYYPPAEEEPEKAAYEVLETAVTQVPEPAEAYDDDVESDGSSSDESDESDYQDFSEEDDDDQEEEDEETPHGSDQLPVSGEYDNVSSEQPDEGNHGDSTDNDVEDEFSFYENDVREEEDQAAEDDLPPLRNDYKEHAYENLTGYGLLHTSSGTNLSSLLNSARKRVAYVPVRNPEPPPLAPRLPEVRSKLLSSTSSISEMQKLLNPAVQPSASMQTFLESADKLFSQSNTSVDDDKYKRIAELPLQRSSSLVGYTGLGVYGSLPKKEFKIGGERPLSPELRVVSATNPLFTQQTLEVTNSESTDENFNPAKAIEAPAPSESQFESVKESALEIDPSAYSVVYDDVGVKPVFEPAVGMEPDSEPVIVQQSSLVYDDIGNVRQDIEKLTAELQSPVADVSSSLIGANPPVIDNAAQLSEENVENDGQLNGEVENLGEELAGDINSNAYKNEIGNDIDAEKVNLSPSSDVNELSDSVRAVEVEKVTYDDVGNLKQSISEDLSSKYEENLTLENSKSKDESVDTEDEFSEIFSEEVGNLEKAECDVDLLDKVELSPTSSPSKKAQTTSPKNKSTPIHSPKSKSPTSPRKDAFAPKLEDSIDFIDTSIVEEKVVHRRQKEELASGELRNSYVELRHSRERDSAVVKDLVMSAINKPSSRRSQERINARSTPDRVFPQVGTAPKSSISLVSKLKLEPQRTSSLDQVDVKLPDTALTSQFGSAPAVEKETISHLWAGVEGTKSLRTLSTDEISNEPTTNFQRESLLNKFANILGSPRKKPTAKSPTSPKSPSSPKSPASPEPKKGEKARVPESLSDAEEMLLQVRDEADRLKIEEQIKLQQQEEDLRKKHEELKDRLVKSMQHEQPGSSREEVVGHQAALLGDMLDTVHTQEKLKPSSETRKKGFFSRFRL